MIEDSIKEEYFKKKKKRNILKKQINYSKTNKKLRKIFKKMKNLFIFT